MPPLRKLFLACALAFGWLATPAHADLLTSLVTERDWIGYAPRNQNPNFGIQPSLTSIRIDLTQLYNAGWRNLYNYSIDGNGREVPRIAKEVGFENVLAGVFYFDEGQLAREKANAAIADPYTDGYIVGNEGLLFGCYSIGQLADAINFFEGFGKPVTTTEVGGGYFGIPALNDLGDFITVNIQPWFNSGLNPFDPVGMAQAVRNEYVAIQALNPGRLVVIKEAWWPTEGHPAATEANQVTFYQALANQTDANGDPVLFMWGESYDQPWKTGESSPFGSLGPDWGMYNENGTPKQIVSALASLYTADYPVNFALGDYDRDGDVDDADRLVWAASVGDSTDIAGSTADGNFDRAFDAADFTVWRNALAQSSAAVPEPTTAWLVAIAAFAARAAVARR